MTQFTPDTYGVLNYKDNFDPNGYKILPVKYGMNMFMTGLGIFGGPPGWIASGLYFMNDAIGGPTGKLSLSPSKAYITRQDATRVILKR